MIYLLFKISSYLCCCRMRRVGNLCCSDEPAAQSFLVTVLIILICHYILQFCLYCVTQYTMISKLAWMLILHLVVLFILMIGISVPAALCSHWLFWRVCWRLGFISQSHHRLHTATCYCSKFYGHWASQPHELLWGTHDQLC